MRAEDGDGAFGDLIDLLDENSAFALQVFDHVAVVDDLVADINRRSVDLQRPLDNIDRALDTSTKPPRLSKNNLHRLKILALCSQASALRRVQPTFRYLLVSLVPTSRQVIAANDKHFKELRSHSARILPSLP